MFEFQHFMDKSEDFRLAYKKLEEIVQQAKKVARSASNYNSSEEFGLLLRKEITSNIVDILIKDIGVVNVDKKHIDKTGTKHKEELGFKTLGKLASGLKDFTFKSINRSNQVQLYEKQGEKIIKGLNKTGLLLPVEFRSEDEQIQKRYVIDVFLE
jgi:dGTPase